MQLVHERRDPCEMFTLRQARTTSQRTTLGKEVGALQNEPGALEIVGYNLLFLQALNWNLAVGVRVLGQPPFSASPNHCTRLGQHFLAA